MSDDIREKVESASKALFALEEALGAPGTEDRQAIYRLRIDLNDLGARFVAARSVVEKLLVGALAEEAAPDPPVPTTMEEALTALDVLLSEEDRAFFLSSEAMGTFKGIRARIELGRFLRNRWGFWGQEVTPLKAFFHAQGITHPDDMSGAILDAYVKSRTGRSGG